MPTADELLGAGVVTELVRHLGGRMPATLATTRDFDGLSLSDRARVVRDALLAELPAAYAPFEKKIRTALKKSTFTGWMIWPVTEAVAVRATTSGKPGPEGEAPTTADTATFDSGLALLADLTPRLTSEFAVRTFMDANLDRTLQAALTWTSHKDEHVRRLATEGTRPFLPWARRVKALTARPDATVPILDALYRDESEYVRRSVANHLNDLSRTDPTLVVTTARRWTEAPDDNTPRLVRHALRTLVKKGDPDALALLGFAPPDGVTVHDLTVTPTNVISGGELTFRFELASTSEQAVAVDYVLHHVRANGTRSPKVFKLTTRTLAPGSPAVLTRSHSFRPISTRRYYPGEHVLEIQVNGSTLARTVFNLG
ncbi:DNA alkylation repair protein [Rhodococcus sp. RS1C4]|uniref:DNA alkylation repair protein n=1 Tax=Rhodococcus sp. 114MFTsu3.1 TaxID=1172184 RepID=UPI00037612BC|nr:MULTISPECIES: DNA alkylation repair protein [unclassified Rhodococcus (in: high G+C Gram-positive bacteria)]OZC54768.1 DNA alkylation repair protein [Rhodococcus sp. RS1C4]OZC82504.1 DNA alkylation repair protein [Rhodococcus sp. 06-418-1B]